MKEVIVCYAGIDNSGSLDALASAVARSVKPFLDKGYEIESQVSFSYPFAVPEKLVVMTTMTRFSEEDKEPRLRG